MSLLQDEGVGPIRARATKPAGCCTAVKVSAPDLGAEGQRLHGSEHDNVLILDEFRRILGGSSQGVSVGDVS